MRSRDTICDCDGVVPLGIGLRRESAIARGLLVVGVLLPVGEAGRLGATFGLLSRRRLIISSMLSRYAFTAAQSSCDSPRSASLLATSCAICTIRSFSEFEFPFDGAVVAITSSSPFSCAYSSVSSTSIAESVKDGVKRWPRTSGVSAVIMLCFSSDELFPGGVAHSHMDTRDETHFRSKLIVRRLKCNRGGDKQSELISVLNLALAGICLERRGGEACAEPITLN